MNNDKLLDEFRQFELSGKDTTKDARKFVLGGYAGSPDTESKKDGKKQMDDCENDSTPPPPQPQPIVAIM